MNNLRLFIRLARPHFLLGGILLYALGAGIARYLGTHIDWSVYLIGQLWGTLLQLSTHFLNEYFDSEIDLKNPNRTFLSGGSGALGPGRLPRATAFWSAAGCLAAVASLTVLLIDKGDLNPVSAVLMVLIFLGAFFYAVPPVRLESSGYGELTTAILLSNLVPAFAFVLQTGHLHRLLAMTTFPLTFLCLAMLLAFELPDYGSDLKYGKRTLLVRAGWQLGMSIHNLMILFGYLILAIAVFLGLSVSIALSVILSLPIGLLQIWSMNRIAAGGKPNWTILTLTGVLMYASAAYLLALTFWTR
jgi:1,4-dihydroxy-2-naphthoate octaprenyltransferase